MGDSKPTVLVVDDDEQLRRTVRRLLEHTGAHVVEADSVASALAAVVAAEGRVSLVLTDLLMPAADGRRLAVRLRRAGLAPAVLYMSGYSPAVVEARYGLPEADVLHKPFTADQLHARVQGALTAR